MFRRNDGTEITDAPDWREKLADLRAAPPWVIERPSWLREPIEVIALEFATLLFVTFAIFYFALAPPSLPGFLPGHVTVAQVAAAPATVAKVTPTTTPRTYTDAERAAFAKALAKDPIANDAFWRKVLAAAPPLPKAPSSPSRHFDYAIASLALAALAAYYAYRMSWIRVGRSG